MRKILSILCAAAISLCIVLSLVSCGGIDGTYEMTSIEGTNVVDGFKSELFIDDYDYYRIILNKDSTVTLESKLKGRQDIYKSYFTWYYEGTTLTLTNAETGNVQIMTLEDGVITCTANETDEVNITLILEK